MIGCCNPDHILGGTHYDNAQDCTRRGRRVTRRGEAVFTAVLTAGDVAEIRRRAAFGEPISSIRKDWPVKWDTISYAAIGRTWKHLPGPVTVVTKASGGGGTRPGRAPGAKLNEHKVREIRRRRRDGEPGRALAKEFGVSPSAISSAVTGRLWGHVK